MQINKKIIAIALVSCIVLSCKKEYSVENGPFDPNNPKIGANCRLSQIVEVDSSSGAGFGSLNAYFNANDQVTRVSTFDSVQGLTIYNADITYSGDTMRVNAQEYFILDASQKAMEFHTFQDPVDTSSGKITFVYSYLASGHLAKKEIFVGGIPIPAVRFTYTWSGDNLTSVEGLVVVPGAEQKLFSAIMTYDNTQTVKNFIPIFPDGFETVPYIMAINLGLTSRNVLTSLSASNYDNSGNLSQTLTTTFTGQKFSPDGYLVEWMASGDLPANSGLPTGLTRFHYHCK
jgi:hypothetical protein